ncbi:HpcH/HpaI aldolase/citrate lyase family protein [Rosistilla ulvae]|uniref:HpcH/HpaI aldolase/citrate lyase family protein n=2 Tax=Rosistilla ulvae TaxID=1930277 RepID=A0A517LWN7_9BACT|nr:HpcH/HpaI aldolase/citrate lyase family protein [Rosistilla ulvae]
MVDLEINGKVKRQGHLDTVISRHAIDDVGKLRSVLSTSELMVRVNPIHADSRTEIDRCVDLGADRIMLPMFTTASEVAQFLKLVGGRTKTCLLLETPASVVRLESILEVPGVEEIHIGLNDLHLGFGLSFMFELVSGGVIDLCSRAINARSIKFGFGGIARLGTGVLPSDLILSEHSRIGSSQVILSRDFQNIFVDAKTPQDAERALRREINKIRNHLAQLKDDYNSHRDNREILSRIVHEYVRQRADIKQAA